jgi:WD40 repeat protein
LLQLQISASTSGFGVDHRKNCLYSPNDGKRVVTASYDKTARIWDAESGKEIVAPQGHKHQVRAASFSPDGQRVVTAS